MTSGTNVEWIFLAVAGVITLGVGVFFLVILTRKDKGGK